ncbi:MAG: hypothetical protein H0T94_03790 [Acidimicrobiia bacterium]|nr:hypothetical protein [Acidimicrobiia bacterium]
MRFLKRFWEPIAAGEVTVAIRRWDRPRVVAGRRYRTAGTILEVDSVETVDEDAISDELALLAGYRSAAELIHELRDRPMGATFVVRFHVVAGPDPRTVLAETDQLSDADIAEINRRLDRLDRSSTHGPWTRQVLEMIASNPGRRAPDLAAELGRETLPFKVDVRKLKNLGLTNSLRVGYELSPRGEAYVSRHAE